MDSLYGGHAGVSFIIKASFKSVADMEKKFRAGAAYRDVWYGEYCLIDTPNKNDADNGKIYQRDIATSNNASGKKYIGQIVGPSSGTPYFQMNTIEEVEKISKEKLGKYEYRRFPIGKDENGKYITASDGNIVVDDYSTSKVGLVPGKKDDGTFNDTIRWTWCNIRKDNADADSWFYVGFEIPYLVQEMQTETVSQYDEKGARKSESSYIKRIDSLEHPYYNEWKLGIPKGIKGDTLRNLKVVTLNESNYESIYDMSAISVQADGTVSFDNTKKAPISADDAKVGRQVLTFDFYYYDKQLNPIPISIYVGHYNMVKGVALAPDGTLTISYTHDDDKVFTNAIRWVNNVVLTDKGQYTETFNYGQPYVTRLSWVKSMSIAVDGTVTYTHTGGENNSTVDTTQSKLLTWVTNVNFNDADGMLTITYNNDVIDGGQSSWQLKYIKSVEVAENGDLIFTNTAGEKTTFAKAIANITNASASADGRITFGYNTGDSINLKKSGSDDDFQIQKIDNVSLGTGLDSDKHIQIKYNTRDTAFAIGDSLNSIADVVVRNADYKGTPKDWHLLVLYSDPAQRGTGEGWVTNVYNSAGNIDNHYWKDFGSIKDDAGILVGLNVKGKETDVTQIVKFLNDQYQGGLGANDIGNNQVNKSLLGKIIAYTNKDMPNSNTMFFAYDYQNNTWFYLGTFGDTNTRDALMVEHDIYSASDLNNLRNRGLLFDVFTYSNVSDNAIPAYWDSTYVG